MRLVAAGLVAIASTLYAQRIVPPEEVAGRLPAHPRGELRCHVEPLPPALDFTLRLHAGYSVTVPLEQSSGPGHRWALGRVLSNACLNTLATSKIRRLSHIFQQDLHIATRGSIVQHAAAQGEYP